MRSVSLGLYVPYYVPIIGGLLSPLLKVGYINPLALNLSKGYRPRLLEFPVGRTRAAQDPRQIEGRVNLIASLGGKPP